jgi:hypothetical protein
MQILTHTRALTMAGLAVALALGVAVLAFGSAAAQAPDPKDQCKHGGYAGFLDPSTGQPFRNQAQCVKFVQQGGTLVPAVDLIVTNGCTRTSPAVVNCTVSVRNAGPGTAIIPAGAVLLKESIGVSGGSVIGVFASAAPGYVESINSACIGDAFCSVLYRADGPRTIAPNQAVTVTLYVNVSSAGATLTNAATADPHGAVTEMNEGNNSVTVTTPP